MQSNVKIAIVGRNEIVREGLRRILLDRNLDVVAVVSTFELLVQKADPEQSIDMIVVDSSSVAEAKSTCRDIKSVLPKVKIILLGEDVSLQATSDAMANGVDGYLAKEISCEPLVCSIELVASGEKVMPSQLASHVMAMKWQSSADDWTTAGSDVRLSNREIEVLRCLTRGEANKNISRALDITEATVKIHIKAIMRKLKVQNRTQAALWAVSRGVAPPPLEMHQAACVG